MKDTLSNETKHFFHVVSNVRPIVWIGIYVLLMPIFAFIYWGLPDGQFRIPDGGTTDFGSWLYYSIVTLTTLGFGDYTPAEGWAQAITAIEVMCGLVTLGFFLNAVGAMKSEIDVESEIEKQRLLHDAQEKEKLIKNRPMLLHTLRSFINSAEEIDKDAVASADISKKNLLKLAGKTALHIDSLQTQVDLTLWPQLLEECFMFVADYQLFSTSEEFDSPEEVSKFLESGVTLAGKIESDLLAVK